MRPFLFIFLSLGYLSCNSQQESVITGADEQVDSVAVEALPEPFDHYAEQITDRSEIVANLQEKVEKGEPLVAHCLVPLCDNENQGIVPTSKSLGDGFSLITNLYWATSYGMKKFFVKNPKWKQLEVTNFDPSDTILERVAFERTYDSGAKVVLICDAYRGDMMEPCVYDYLNSLAGYKSDSINFGGDYLRINQDADLLAFNGHNGLMDVWADTVFAEGPRNKDAVVVACASESYFLPHYIMTHSYPLVNTTTLLWPGAMCLDRILQHWANFESEEVIANGAGDAYHEVKECGRQAARNMFSTGW